MAWSRKDRKKKNRTQIIAEKTFNAFIPLALRGDLAPEGGRLACRNGIQEWGRKY